MTIVEDAEVRPTVTPVSIGGVRGGPDLTTVLRKDRWWVQPALTVFGLTSFVVYGTWAAFRGSHWYVGFTPTAGFATSGGRDYLSPFYSPCLTNACFSHGYGWGPITASSISPALLVLIFPLAFRATCYYYRKAYYRSFWGSPPACAVADAGSKSWRRRYSGETKFPLIIQNVHRYTWYFAVIFAGILTWDAITAFRFPNGVGMALGTVFFVVNAVLIWLYTLSCHACRHLCGGHLKSFSKAPIRKKLWDLVTPLNGHHMLFAWMSLISIVVCDFYVFLVSMGTIHDPRFF